MSKEKFTEVLQETISNGSKVILDHAVDVLMEEILDSKVFDPNDKRVNVSLNILIWKEFMAISRDKVIEYANQAMPLMDELIDDENVSLHQREELKENKEAYEKALKQEKTKDFNLSNWSPKKVNA